MGTMHRAAAAVVAEPNEFAQSNEKLHDQNIPAAAAVAVREIVAQNMDYIPKDFQPVDLDAIALALAVAVVVADVECAAAETEVAAAAGGDDLCSNHHHHHHHHHPRSGTRRHRRRLRQ